MPPRVHGANRIVPSGFHVPVYTFGVSEMSPMAVAGPPSTPIFFSLPSTKNPTALLSGDQNGEEPPSVSGSRRASSTSSDRIQINLLPPDFPANAIFVP